ncbi:MAG: putative bifunctional diguanylate cyclase/phosphodiesterase [Gammaproteobacteria bacterium]
MRSPLLSKRLPIYATVIYLFLSSLWIIFTSLTIDRIPLPAHERALAEIFKGLTFVLLSAIGLYVLLERFVRASVALSNEKYLARHDPLTHLLNRTAWIEEATYALRHLTRSEARIALIDIDQLRYINGAFGNHSGDFILRYVADQARHLQQGPGDILGRVGPSQFAFFMAGADDRRAQSAFEGMFKASLQPVQIGLHSFRFSLGIGICRYPQDAGTIPDLLNLASIALDTAKQALDRHEAYYSQTAAKTTIAAMRLETDLARALERREFRLHYQPILAVKDLSLVAVEALVRWQHPILGLVPPNMFITAAERSGLIHDLGRFVLEEATQTLAQVQPIGHQPLAVSINLSTLQFNHQDLVQSIIDCLEEARYPSDRLIIEITESTLMTEPERISRILDELQALRIRVALDDFGTGYSSLAYLQKLPIQILKIDRSMIEPMPKLESARHIVDALIDLAHGLGLTVIAEGIEHVSELEALKETGCDWVQGFLFSKPIPWSELSTRVQGTERGFIVNPTGLSKPGADPD